MDEILFKYWHHKQFRPLQREVIDHVMQGRDTLVLMPTGGGKSLCYQVPSMAMEGICIVVSPLIALMKDQVEILRSKGIQAMAIFSGMSKREVDIALDNCVYGAIKFLYLSPERLMSELVRERIRYMKVNLFAIDEAHCISEWGYDFRPPYLHLSDLRELQPDVPFIALTATATEQVVEDIQQKLAFRKPDRGNAVFRTSFARSNLAYIVLKEESKFSRLLNIIRKVGGSGIVYVRNRRETQEIARYLLQEKVSADFYHAGLSTPDRGAKQDAWRRNHTQVIVATNAFGMGIDKPDVRFVVHMDVPSSLEAYYQEAGRAGRDGQKAYAVLLYNEGDKERLETNFLASFPTVAEIRQIYYHLCNYYQLAYGAGQFMTFNFDVGDFCTRYQLDVLKTLSALKFLERSEWIALTENVYLPSRLQFEVNPSDLYTFQVAHAHLDSFIKTILRAYGNAFDRYISFRESDLARKMGLPISKVIDMLEQLQKFEVISYIPQTDKPQLQFLLPRSDSQHLEVDRQHIEARKAVGKKQLKAVMRFLDDDLCRSVSLLDYFDEHDATRCGICDVCLRLQGKKAESRIEQIRQEIITALESEARALKTLLADVDTNEEDLYIHAIREMVDEGILIIEKELYVLNKKLS